MKQIIVRKNNEISQNAAPKELVKDSRLQCVAYTLPSNGGLSIIPDTYDSSSFHYVLSGKVCMNTEEGQIILEPHDSVLLTNLRSSISINALESSQILTVSTEATQKVELSQSLVKMQEEVENRDVYTYGHNYRVSLYATTLALALNPAYDIAMLGIAATLHDVGKINVPIEILRKPGKLTKEEYEIIKKHPWDSYLLIRESCGEQAAMAAGQHHERLDGSGYPKGLKGNEILMDARIIAVADVFDAMTCKRIYNQPMPPLSVVEYLEQCEGQYDKAVVSVLRRMVENGTLKLAQ